MHPFLTIADRAARLAGKRIIQALDKNDRLKIYEKSSNELVTELDLEVERLIIDQIQSAYPTHSILSEESGFLERESEYLWLIDPIDGTNNFIKGIPSFCISIAVKRQGDLYQSLIYDPIAQETFYASAGRGAQLNHRRIRVSEHRKLQHAMFYVNRPSNNTEELETWSNLMQTLSKKSASIRLLGSAALGLAYVAAGRLDGFVSLTTLKPWDVAAGALLIQEAGGGVINIKADNQPFKTEQLIAANASLDKQLSQLLSNLV